MKNAPLSPSRRRPGFTLLELMLSIALVAALTLMAWRGYGIYVQRADSAACIGKMRNFHAALLNYVTEKQTWPDESILEKDGRKPTENQLWDWWYTTMKDYGVGEEDWYCPADLRKRAKNPKDAKPGEDDADELGFKPTLKDQSYIPAKFSYGPTKPYEYNQPWLTERQDFHNGEGMNKVMFNGSVRKEFSLENLKKMRQSSSK
jgi:prepilin-type N-terminal cleavage/methylation domain-containing protein